MKLDLLAIAPHPDDVELTCGGTMIKMAQAGYTTGILDLTKGETGSRGTPETRLREAARAAKIPGRLGPPQSRTAGRPFERMRGAEGSHRAGDSRVSTLDRDPALLGRAPPGSLHFLHPRLRGLFHRGAEKLSSWRGGLSSLQNYICRCVRYGDAHLRGGHHETVRAAQEGNILAYLSQFDPSVKQKPTKVYLPLDELENRMSLLARGFGYRIGVKYGEGFVVKELMQVEDVVEVSRAFDVGPTREAAELLEILRLLGEAEAGECLYLP